MDAVSRAFWFTVYFCSALMCFVILFAAIMVSIVISPLWATAIPVIVFISYIVVAWTLNKATQ